MERGGGVVKDLLSVDFEDVEAEDAGEGETLGGAS